MSAVSIAVDQIESALKSRGYEDEQAVSDRKKTILRYLAPLEMLEVERDAARLVANDQALEIARLRAELTIATATQVHDPVAALCNVADDLRETIDRTLYRIEALPAGTLPDIPEAERELDAAAFFDAHCTVRSTPGSRLEFSFEGECNADHGPKGTPLTAFGARRKDVEDLLYQHIEDAHPTVNP